MARLEAIIRMGYFPTPDRVTSMVAKVVHPFSTSWTKSHRLLDPCCGCGTAAQALARAWNCTSHGVELDAARAAEASTRLNECLHGSLRQLEASKEAFSILYLNPPYDRGAREGGRASRQEIHFLQDALPFLTRNDGLLVYVVPRAILRHPTLIKILNADFDKSSVQAFEFPSPEIDDFDQVVLLAKRAPYASHYNPLKEIEVVPYDQIEKVRTYGINPRNLETFRVLDEKSSDWHPSWARANHVYGSLQWELLAGEQGLIEKAPLTAPRPGHQALLLAAGVLDDTSIGEGLLMKGTSQKITVVAETTKRDDGTTVETHREQIVSRLSTLDLRTGNFESWLVNEEQAKTSAFLQEHREALQAAMADLRPQFNGDLGPYETRFAQIKAPGVLPGHQKSEILPVQKQTAAAICHNWRTGEKATLLSGEIGVGKTTTAAAAMHLYGARKIVVICPSHLTAKWRREASTILGSKAVVAKRVADVDAFFNDPTTRTLVISKEMAKLGAKWALAFPTRKRTVIERIPSSYNRYYHEEVKVVREIALCPDCGAEQVDENGVSLLKSIQSAKNRPACVKCKAPLWTHKPISEKGTCRWPLASYIAKRYARRYSLILDECHQFAKASTGQTQAVQDLISSAKKVLAMTGSLYGGRASSIFQLLFMLFGSFRRLYAYDECARFVGHHGLFETKTETEERVSVYGIKRGGTSRSSIREIPGMSPAMIPLLLPVTAFLKIKDLEIDLPPYSEEVQILPLDADVLKVTEELARDVKSVLRGHPEVLGQYLMACLGYPDRPDQEEKITTADGEILASAPAFIDALDLSKDRATVEIALEEHARGRKTLVYFSQTHRRDARGRVKEALEAAGLRVKILDSNVPADKREDWLKKALASGFDVLLTNGRLVETGLDLLFANTIVQYGIEYSIATLRQSVRRSWRLGQDKPVRVVFLGYAGTMQEIALNLIARKMRASELIEGDDNGGLAQYDAAGDDFFSELAHELFKAAA